MGASFKQVGNWQGMIDSISPATMAKRLLQLEATMGKAVKAQAKTAGTIIKTGKAKGPPLSSLTVKLKGHKRKLFHTGTLSKAFRSERVNKHTWRVGIPRNLRYKSGEKVTEVAARNEFGGNLVVNNRVRAQLAKQGVRLRHSTTVIRIPARPYREPATIAMRKITKKLLNNYIKRAAI